MATVDSLDIQISAQANKASASLESLSKKLDRVSASLSGVNTRGLATMGAGVNKLANAMNNFSSNTKTTDFTRLARNLNALSNINGSAISKASDSITKIANATKAFEKIKVSDSAKQLGDLAKGISQLGYKSSTQAVENIPKLATAMKDLMGTLSKAPKVNQNLIDMTNALAKLARTGSSSGKAADSLSRSFTNLSVSGIKTPSVLKGMQNNFRNLIHSIAPLVGVIQLINFGKKAIEISSDLTEVQNVVDVTFGDMASKVEDFAQTSIQQFGMSSLTLKETASRFQAMGTAMGIDPSLIGSANKFLSEQTSGYIEMSDSMSDVSLNLTKLTADMASFYNVEQDVVSEDLAAIFTGQTRPLRAYGLDLTEATLKEWALNNGLNANIDTMSQAEKTMLRYQYVLANTGAAQGDFARTANTWANQIRILKQQFQQFASVIGTGLIAAFKPFVQTLNKVMAKVISFSQNVLNALGQIFGWQFEISGGGIADDLGDASSEIFDSASGAGDLADNLADAAKNAKKLKTITLGIDELNINAPDDDFESVGIGGAGGGTGGGAGGAGTGTGLTTAMTRNDAILKAYESSIKNLEQLGEYIGDTLSRAMESIKWDKVYEKARNFGTGLADFLNGLISPRLFGNVGTTIAGSLNTAIYAALSFGKEFDFYDFGVSIATGINEFFKTFDFASLAETLNVWVDGIEDAIEGALKTLDKEKIKGGIEAFFDTLELDTVSVIIGTLIIKKILGLKLGKEVFDYLKKKLATSIGEKISLLIGGVSLGKIALKIKGFALSFAKIDPAGFSILGSQLLKSIGDAVYAILPSWAEDFIENVVAGVSVGGIAGSWLPGLGTLAGAVIGGITGALNGIKIDGKSILKTIIDKIFNWDWARSLFDESLVLFKKAFSGKEKWSDIGLYIIEGIGKGILGALVGLVEPILDLFEWTYEEICKVFGIHSPATSMVPIGENIFLGIIEGFKSLWGLFTETIGALYEEKIKPWFSKEKWAELGENVKRSLSEKFQEARMAIEQKFLTIGEWFSQKYESVKQVFFGAPEYFREKFEGAYTKVKEAFQTIGTWFQGKWDAVKGVFKDVKEFFRSGFQSAYDAVKKIWGGLGNFFKGIAENAFKPIKKLINAIISGVNWILDKVDSSTRLEEWPGLQFAKGSDGIPRNTIGMVNDQKGATYKELIVPPKGKPFIPEGRNVMLPLEKGTKIMPARQTRQLLENMPHFASGIGDFFGSAWEKLKSFTGDIWDYISEPGKIVQIAIDKFTDISGMVEPWLSVAGGIVNKTFGAIKDYIAKIFGQLMPKVDYNPSAGVEQWRKLAAKALQITGQFSESNLTALLTQMQHESGGNPKAINNWDINAQRGTPSKGLMQVIDPTFRANALAPYNKDIYDPLSNMIAAIRYTLGRYGSLYAGWTARGYKGYASGIGKIGIADLIPQYSAGGFPEDGLFYANHSELVGQFSDGRTAVANNEQIAAGIEEAAYRGFMRAMRESENTSLLSDIAENTRAAVNKEIVARIDPTRETVSALRSAERRYGYPLLQV